MKYCVANIQKNTHYVGDTKADIVAQVCEWRLVGTGRRLFVRFKNGKENEYHSYSNDWTIEEIRLDVVRFIYQRLDAEGFMKFTKDI